VKRRERDYECHESCLIFAHQKFHTCYIQSERPSISRFRTMRRGREETFFSQLEPGSTLQGSG